jgi:AcrR family transcriptional regulator
MWLGPARGSKLAPRAWPDRTMARRKTPTGPDAGEPGDLERSRGYHHGNLRQALLDAAAELVSERGVDAFTLREVARRARVSHAAPYRHFADRAALVAAASAHALDELRGRMVQARQRGEAPAPAELRASARAYLGFALEQPARFRMMFGPEATEGVPAESLLRELAAAIAADQRAAKLHPGEPADMALAAWAAVHGAAALAVDGRLGRASGAAAIADRVVDALFHGFAPR